MLSHFSFPKTKEKEKKKKKIILEASGFLFSPGVSGRRRWRRRRVGYILIHGEFVTTGGGSTVRKVKWRGGVATSIMWPKHGHISGTEGTTTNKAPPTSLLTVVPQKHSAIDLNNVHTEAFTKVLFSVYTHRVFLPLKWFASHFWEWPVKNYFLFRQQPVPDSSVQMCFFFSFLHFSIVLKFC